MLTEKDDGGRVEAMVDERVEILLEENPTTGFRWDLDPKSGAAVEIGTRIPLGEPEAPGAGGRRRIVVVAHEPGVHRIRLLRRRSWNDEVNETFELTLVARERPA